LIRQSNQIKVDPQDISIFHSPAEYKEQLLKLIAEANNRIYITALYLQDDDAGREILTALFEAKQANPALDIKVFVDSHRAQRGLIGAKEQLGNRALYLSHTQKYEHPIDIHGVAVKNKELFGVLHLKGMVFDDCLFYTGASINDVYLHQHEKYRLDRYYTIQSKALADSFVEYLRHVFVNSELAPRLNQNDFPSNIELKKLIHQLKLYLTKVRYTVDQKNSG
jgi:CDP-diacylglycerol--serine O-phosphatidyltransferase